MELDLLRTPEGEAALAAAAATDGGDALAAAAGLRRAGFPPELASAALTQAELRRRATAKFGADADVMFFTRAGLEQATRATVAARRAARLHAAGVRVLADLGCGLGADAIAAARAGIRVHAVEADPHTAALTAANAAALGLTGLITVTTGDATEADLSGVDAVFCDPARRASKTGRRVFDPASFSPPWDFVAGLAARVPRTVLKLSPGIDHALIPDGAEAEWVSVGGDVVEAAFWCGPLAGVPRRATVLPDGGELTGEADIPAEVGGVRRYVYDPDGAVVRAHLVAAFADRVGGVLADPQIAYVYADTPAPTGFGRCLEVLDTMPFSLKRLRAELRRREIGRVEILKRGSALDVPQLRRDLRLSGPAELSLVLTRVAGAPVTLLCRPVPSGNMS
ncbi:class I SAM-dependent methyltransferase [Catenuloplanes niger JCM 9533]|uniref:Protein-L-isoaspartate O-methyltransferase n=1 Tax=Catenuloplanes niger TaxID=587534 RepID=A0AAE3ZPQ2_9ACTN|nr:SAM-dependent methyltransferase [Catenuloplanes niger]MDR7322817.1 protein-L-isoaspartate O-methyltransferase [Catenuloplanes niger]